MAAGSLNINYINECVISLAVMKGTHTHVQDQQGEGQCGEMFAVFQQNRGSINPSLLN